MTRGREVALAPTVTNADGRTDALLLDVLEVAGYELRFGVGAHFAARGHEVTDPPVLDIVPMRLTIGDPTAHHHVPLARRVLLIDDVRFRRVFVRHVSRELRRGLGDLAQEVVARCRALGG